MPKIAKPVSEVVQPKKCMYIGIDPGQKGGLVALISKAALSINEVGYTEEYTPMPTTERDVYEWFLWLGAIKCPKVALIEKVHSMPKQGVASSFSFGRNYGFLHACLHAAGIKFEEITPQAWLKGLGIPQGKNKGVEDKQWKNHLRGKAQELFPELPIWKEKRALGKQLAISDALLISEMCRRKFSG